MHVHKAVLSYLSTRVLNTPLLIAPAKLETILGVIGPRIGLETQEIDIPISESRGTERHSATGSDIAIIPVYGTLVQRTQGLQTVSGLRSYGSIRQDFKTALADPGVAAILFDFDSNGGEVAGVHDLIDEIYKARGTKPIYAYANESAYSAAYGLASAADEIIIPRTGGVGSIGVVAVHVDQSEADKEKGLKYTPIYAGAKKIDFSEHQPLSDQARESVQKDINQIYDLFTKTVARNRKAHISLQEIRDTEAGIYMGKQAVKVGLADQVMSWDAAIKYIQTKMKKGGMPMNSIEATKQIETILGEDGVKAEEVMSGLGYALQSDMESKHQKEIQAAKDEAAVTIDAAVQRVNEITDICLLAEKPEMIKGFLEGEMSVEDVRKAVMDAKAKASPPEIISTVGAISTGEVNPLIANAKKRASKAKKEVA